MGTFGETLEDNSMEEIQNDLVVGSLHAEVNAVLKKLTSRESGILRMRYGLDDGQPKTLEDIGNAFNVRSHCLSKYTPSISVFCDFTTAIIPAGIQMTLQ